MGLLDAPSLTKQAADAAYRLSMDKGEALISALDIGVGNCRIGIAGDSTGNASDEWADMLMGRLATRYPDRTITIPHWNDTTQAYDTATAVQTGTTPSPGIVYLDTFTRTAADLYATVPDIGGAWGRDGSNASGDWSIDGSSAVRTADATVGMLLADGQQSGDLKLTLNATVSTVGTGVARNLRFYLYKDGNNGIFVQIAIGTTGIVSWTVFKRIAGTNTQIASGGATPLPTNTAGVSFDLAFQLSGTTVSATLAANPTITGTITSGDQTALSGMTMVGLNSSGFVEGDKINQFQIETLTSATPNTLTFYNASMSGSVLTYHQARLAAMYPQPLDLLFISSSHNYGADTPAQYQAKLDTFIAAFRAVQPTAGIVLCSQNPQKAPATNRVAHGVRNATLRSYAARKGYGYIPVAEAFSAQTLGGVSLVNADGIHPTNGTTGTGSSLWRDAAYTYLTSLSLRPA